jgi:hypothetical protein
MFHGKITIFNGKTMENHHFIAGKIHYFDWVIFNSYVSHYQRVHPWKSMERNGHVPCGERHGTKVVDIPV